MGEVRRIGEDLYSPANTRQINFAEGLYLIVGSVPQAFLGRNNYSVVYSGSARYSASPHSSAVTLSPNGWLPFRPVDDAWLDAFVKHYSMLMVLADLGALDGLDCALLSAASDGGVWVTPDRYSGDATTLLRVRLVKSYDYRLVTISTNKAPRVVKSVNLDRDHAKQFECAYLARSGRPKRVIVISEGDRIRFRVPRMPALQQTALQHLSHEEDLDNGIWRVARSAMLPIIEHIAKSARVEVVLK